MTKHRILLGAALIICIAINISVNFDGEKKLTSSLNSLITQAYADGEDGDDGTETYIDDHFVLDVSTTVTANVEVDAGGIITKVLGFGISGGVEVTKTVSYTCCQSGGGKCSDVNPLCSEVGTFALLVGMSI